MNNCIIFVSVMIVVVFTEINVANSQRTDLANISEKINRLERDVQVLSRRVFKGETSVNVSGQNSSASAPRGGIGSANIIRLEDRLAGLRGELQNSTNRMESISHSLDGIKARLDKLVSDIDFRLSRLENIRGKDVQANPLANMQDLSGIPRAAEVKRIGPSTGGPIVSSAGSGILGKISESNLSEVKDQASKKLRNNVALDALPKNKELQQKFILPKGTPKSQYLYALSILRKTKYKNAELAFSEFIIRHPKDKLTPNARYWLGESFYVRKNYRSAAEAFLRGYQQAPKGVKAPGSLLKLGMSLANLKKKQDACATFSKLAKDYPDASENIKKHLDREFKRSSCN